jgi:hypothetical protein
VVRGRKAEEVEAAAAEIERAVRAEGMEPVRIGADAV